MAWSRSSTRSTAGIPISSSTIDAKGMPQLSNRGEQTLPSCRDHSLQDLAFMVDGAPEIAELAVDLHKDLIQTPAPLRGIVTALWACGVLGGRVAQRG